MGLREQYAILEENSSGSWGTKCNYPFEQYCLVIVRFHINACSIFSLPKFRKIGYEIFAPKSETFGEQCAVIEENT